MRIGVITQSCLGVAIAAFLTWGIADSAAQTGGHDAPASVTNAASEWPTSFAGVQNSIATLEAEERKLVRLRKIAAERVKALRRRRLLNGRHYARLARAGLLPLGGGLKQLSQHAAQLQRLRRALTRDLELEQRLDRGRVEMAAQLDKLRNRKAPLEAQRRTMNQLRAAGLAAQDRELAFERAFSGSFSGAHAAVYSPGIGPADSPDIARGFASLKGRLAFPVPGRAEITEVRRRGAGGVGLEMRVALGSAVRATYPGRVGFAARYADYGQTVILDHGGGYFTVTANLELISVGLGDEVAAGSRLGTVGGGDGTGTLYFEIRKDGQVVDPAPWFGI